jgi:hypothetical protein
MLIDTYIARKSKIDLKSKFQVIILTLIQQEADKF